MTSLMDRESSLLDYIQDSIILPQKESFVLVVSLEGLRTAEKVKELLRQNRDIRRIFDLVIIDEAHYLRNSNTRSFETGELLRDVSESFLLLSATPIQTGSDNFYNLLRLLSDEEFHNKSNFEMQLMENYPLVKLASAIDENDDLKTVITMLQATLASTSYKRDSDILELTQTIDAVMASTSRRIETVAKIRGKYFYDGFVTRTRKRDVIENRTERKAAAINYPLSPVERSFYEQVTAYLKSKGDKENVFSNFSLITRQRQMASCMPAALESWRASSKEEQSSEEDDSVFADLDIKSGSAFRSVTMPYFENIELSTHIPQSVSQKLNAAVSFLHSQTFVEGSSNEVGHVDAHIVVIIQYDILPISWVPLEPGGDVVAAFPADIGCLVVDLHAKLLQPLLQMEIGNWDLPPGGGHNDDRASGIHDAPELLQGGLVEQVIMIHADAFVEHLNGPGAVVEHAVHIEKNHFVHCQTSFRCRVHILLHR